MFFVFFKKNATLVACWVSGIVMAWPLNTPLAALVAILFLAWLRVEYRYQSCEFVEDSLHQSHKLDDMDVDKIFQSMRTSHLTHRSPPPTHNGPPSQPIRP